MVGHMFDGLAEAVGCLLIITLLLGVTAGFCAAKCPYRPHVTMERVTR